MAQKFEPGTLARVIDTVHMHRILPEWAGQMVIIERFGSEHNIFNTYTVRRLHDGAKEWWYTDQLEHPADIEEQDNAGAADANQS